MEQHLRRFRAPLAISENVLDQVTAESTMIPKSIAPTDRRFASSPSSTRMMMLKNRANGMLTPTMTALRRSPRNIH
jgi:hypothetical protein